MQYVYAKFILRLHANIIYLYTRMCTADSILQPHTTIIHIFTHVCVQTSKEWIACTCCTAIGCHGELTTLYACADSILQPHTTIIYLYILSSGMAHSGFEV